MLSGIGLSGSEETVYLSLLDLGAASLPELDQACVDQPNAAVLAGLENKGLVTRMAGIPTRYVAAPPDVALESLVAAREDELRRIRLEMDTLASRYRQARLAEGPEQVIDVVTSREATVQRWEHLQRSAREQVRSFDRPPYVTDPTANPVEMLRLGEGVTFRSVYHPAGFDLPGRPQALRELIAAGEQARVAAAVPVKMFIADDRLALLPLTMSGTAESCLVIHASSLLDTLIALFESVWSQAIPVHADGSAPGLLGTPTEDDATLLGLLAAGLTDHAISRQLQLHPRTVQRRVRGLLEQLGAMTRFQAGLQATRRGWL